MYCVASKEIVSLLLFIIGMEVKLINFKSSDKMEWLATISSICYVYGKISEQFEIALNFDNSITPHNLEPMHLVTLACAIHYLDSRGHRVVMGEADDGLVRYLFEDLDFSAYWVRGRNHVEAHSSKNIFNLWRIIESEKDLYAKNVEEYFKRNYFQNKDLSAVSISLVEAFYNVFDHAHAAGNAFSLLKYDEKSKVLAFAISDFGIGIPSSVRLFDYQYLSRSDEDAIKWALEDHASVHSSVRNKGFGMSNILSSAMEAHVISGNGVVVKTDNDIHTQKINFSFPGTLIFQEIDLTTFEDEVILDSFNW